MSLLTLFEIFFVVFVATFCGMAAFFYWCFLAFRYWWRRLAREAAERSRTH